MRAYETYLQSGKLPVHYIEHHLPEADAGYLFGILSEEGFRHISCSEVCDDWLEKKILKNAASAGFSIHFYTSPLFLNTREELDAYFDGRKRYYQTEFYIAQRKQRKVLLTSSAEPLGDKWSFDTENRLKYPRSKKAPGCCTVPDNSFQKEAREYIAKYFSRNYGQAGEHFLYPVTHGDAQKWLKEFLQIRFHDFGKYEDAIVKEEVLLHHSLLSPLLNSGLLLPGEVLDEAMQFAQENGIPLNTLEGFVRQIMGWREFIRAVYYREGAKQRTTNYWKFKRKIPPAFYNGTTGIEPIDTTIKKVLSTGYNHHIERLMVLGNFMVLCEFDPDEVYKWFMELYIDAYDWVMVPNIYGMSQFSDGGIMTTKPYISGSNYLLKMSDYNKGEWTVTWDALFWRFMHVHRDYFGKNPRLGMLLKTFDKMPEDKQSNLLQTAENYLLTLDNHHAA